MALVVDKHVAEVQALVTGRSVTVVLTPEARAWLAERGFDRAFGARPMARLVERVIKRPLSNLLLFDDLAPGATLTAENVDGDLRLCAGA